MNAGPRISLTWINATPRGPEHSPPGPELQLGCMHERQPCASVARQGQITQGDLRKMNEEIQSLARARWRVALALSCAVFVLYFGFILAVAFARQAMATQVVTGLTWGILLGALVIVGAWLTTWIYVSWANRHFDGRLSRIAARQDQP